MKIYLLLFVIIPLCQCTSFEKTIDVGPANGESVKRSGGSFDIIRSLKTGLISGIGRASAAIASGSSGSSSGGGYTKHVEIAHTNSIDFDPWSLKKSVLNTLFQAVKAITGGVTAIKGQLIKGSGYAISASGKLIAASGDKVTDVGKAIASSAKLSPSPSYGTHPFAGKFSSLSGLSSSSSSSSHTSHSNEYDSHGPTAHSETTFEIPSGGAHASYGPPVKTASYNTGGNKYLPSDPYPGTAGAVHFTSAAFEGPISPSAGHTKYGVPSQVAQQYHHYGHQSEQNDYHHQDSKAFEHEYISESNEHQTHNDFLSNTGLTPYGGTISANEAKSASEALKEIMKYLPKTTQTTDLESGHKDNFVEQYDIPPDPVHTFKPLTVPSANRPIQSISHSQSITTAYGSPFTNNYENPQHVSQIDVQNSISLPLPADVSTQTHYEPQPYDVYHNMKLKYGAPNPTSDIDTSFKTSYLPPTGPSYQNYHTQIHNKQPPSTTFLHPIPSGGGPYSGKPNTHLKVHITAPPRPFRPKIGAIIAALEGRSDKLAYAETTHLHHFQNRDHKRHIPIGLSPEQHMTSGTGHTLDRKHML